MAWFACRISVVFAAESVCARIRRKLDDGVDVTISPSTRVDTILIGTNAWSKAVVDAILATPGVFRFSSAESLSPTELRVLAPTTLARDVSIRLSGPGVLDRDWLVPRWGHWSRRNQASGVVIAVLLAASVLARLSCSS